MPTSSSLVTNLPADFNTFGQAVDTSMSELLGGTTGQVLSKTSNTNMDFTWVTPTDQTPLTTKGDLLTFTTVDARLAVGANNTVLIANSAQSTGLQWVANRRIVQIVTGSTTTQTGSSSATYADTTLTATITPTLSTSEILVFVTQAGCQKYASNTSMGLRLVRGATTILQMAALAGGDGSTGDNQWGTIAATYLDAPATTSATTYKTTFNSTAGTTQTTVQHGSPTSTIVLMEVSA